MSVASTSGDSPRAAASQVEPIPLYLNARSSFAAHYLFGDGLEIGPLHQPLAIPTHARVRYVDRMQVEDLRREYQELAEWNLTRVDIVDDGEKLTTIDPESQDFIVANHFLEHTEDPIGTIETHLGKLRPGGILFYAVPDKRFTFDFRRPLTSLEHLIADHEQGPERSRREHYDDWARFVIGAQAGDDESSRAEWQRRGRELEAAQYSIHMHVWTEVEFLALVLHCRERFQGGFDIEAAARQGIEFIVVLRKAGPLPQVADAASPAASSLRKRVRRALRAAKRELRAG